MDKLRKTEMSRHECMYTCGCDVFSRCYLNFTVIQKISRKDFSCPLSVSSNILVYMFQNM
jgi:hypothetical protein